jgi:hypothetical protein
MAGFTEVVAILYVICTTDIVCVSGTPSPANKLVPVPPPPPPSSHQQLHTLEHLVSDLRDQVPYVFTGVQDLQGSALF